MIRAARNVFVICLIGSLVVACSSPPPNTSTGGGGPIIPGNGGDGGSGGALGGSGGSGGGGTGGLPQDLPEVDRVEPRRGSTVGGDAITITGLHFVPGQNHTVLIGSGQAVGLNVIDSDTILATTPPGTAGDVDVSVKNDGGTGVCTGCFHYDAPARLDQVDPAEGFLFGGDQVKLSGLGLTDSVVVLFGSRRATNVTAGADGTLTVTTPPGDAEGAVDVEVFDASGHSTLRRAFTYWGRLAISAIDPPGGPLSGGNHATIQGTGLGAATSVLVGGKTALMLPRADGTLDVTIPPGDAAGAVDVEVRTGAGSKVQHSAYAYFDPAQRGVNLYVVSPPRGPLAGGNSVTLVGTGLDSGLLVAHFGAAQATVTGTGANLVTVTAPPGAAGAVDVSVRVASGGATLAGAYRYFAPITVTSVSPGAGPEAGGTAITLTGSNFPDGALAYVGSGPVAQPVLASSGKITCLTPPGTDGMFPVRVEDPADPDNIGVLPAGFEYQGTFSLLNLQPVSGSRSGGTAVTLLGTGFRAGLMATFGGNDALKVTVVDPFTAVAVTPRGNDGTVDVGAVAVASDTGLLRSAFTYFNPQSSGGGSSGGPLTGTLNVTVLDAGQARFGLPIVGATVVVGTVDTGALTGFTDDRGQITFSDPTLVKSQLVSVTFPAYEQVTVVDQATENLTVYLRPNKQPTQCNDGIDNDGDGTIDSNGGPHGEPPDKSCMCDPSQSPRPEICMCPTNLAPPVEYNECCDGIDNDGDGLTDKEDPDCGCSMGFTESLPQCSDCIDNDGDGGIDFYGGPNGEPPDTACTSPDDDDERGGIVSGRVFGFKLPPAYKLQDGDEVVAQVMLTRSSVYAAPPWGSVGPSVTVARDGGTYSFEIPGKQHMAVYAYFGVRNGNTFTPMLLGIHRNVNSDPAHPITDGDVVLNVALDQTIQVSLLNSPAAAGSLVGVFGLIDLGQDGLIPLKQSTDTSAAVDQTGTLATLKYAPRLQGDYMVFEALGEDPQNGVPFTLALRRQPGEVRTGVTLGPLMGVPRLVTPPDDGTGIRPFNGVIEWDISAGPQPVVITLEIEEQILPSPVPQWNFIVPGGEHRVVVPDSVLQALRQKYPKGTDNLTITLQTGTEPRFAFDQWNYQNLSLTAYTSFAEDKIPIKIPPL